MMIKNAMHNSVFYYNFRRLLCKRVQRLGCDERGGVLWFGLIILFLALAIFSMSYDTSNYIAQKMKAQNAADAAAIEMATWQARGLNVIQEINCDIYEIDAIMKLSIETMAVVAASLDAGMIAAILSFQFEIYKPLSEIKSDCATINKFLLIAFWTLRNITINSLKFIRKVYVYGTNVAGYLSAMQVAGYNGAVILESSQVKSMISQLNTDSSGILSTIINKLNSKKQFGAIGIPLSTTNPFILPVDKKNDDGTGIINTSALYSKNWELRLAKTYLSISMSSTKSWLNKILHWDDEYYQTKDGFDKGYYPAWVWIARTERPWLMSDSLLWRKSGQETTRPIPMAYAIAQVRGGNVVRYANKTKSRNIGYGAGAEAALVPISEAKNLNSKFVAFLENLMFMH